MNPISCVLSLGLACFASPGAASSSDGLHGAATTLVDHLTAQAPDAPAETASSVLTKVQAFYDGTEDLTATFKQTYFNPTFGAKPSTAKGTLRLKKPGMMIWDYAAESDPDFWADGARVYVVEHDTRQVVSKSVAGEGDLDAAMKFLFGGQKLVRDFKVRFAAKDRQERYGDAKHHVVELKPKVKNERYKGLVLVVSKDTGRVDGFVVYNQDGSTNHFELSAVKTNQQLAAALFNFQVPSGYVESKED
jgi:outer membrane lipoprotein carrier protein